MKVKMLISSLQNYDKSLPVIFASTNGEHGEFHKWVSLVLSNLVNKVFLITQGRSSLKVGKLIQLLEKHNLNCLDPEVFFCSDEEVVPIRCAELSSYGCSVILAD